MDILNEQPNPPELSLNEYIETNKPISNDTLSDETKRKIRKLMKADDEQLTRTDSYWEKLRKEDPHKHNALTAQRFADAVRLQDKFFDNEEE